MFYVLLILSITNIVYNYHELIKNDKDIKTFVVISGMIILTMIYSFFLDELRQYSLLKIFKIFSEFTMPWFIEFMKT